MGLKTNNYVSKRIGITLPVAYAVLRTLEIDATDRVRATFTIQTDRENAKKYAPIDKVEINFTWDRKTDPAKMAYETAKTEIHEVYMWDGTKKEETKVTEYGTLYGWEDDIV